MFDSHLLPRCNNVKVDRAGRITQDPATASSLAETANRRSCDNGTNNESDKACYHTLTPPDQVVTIGGQQSIASGQQNPVSGQQNPVSGQQNLVSGQQNPVSGQQNPVSGQQNPISGQQNSASGQQSIARDQQLLYQHELPFPPLPPNNVQEQQSCHPHQVYQNPGYNPYVTSTTGIYNGAPTAGVYSSTGMGYLPNHHMRGANNLNAAMTPLPPPLIGPPYNMQHSQLVQQTTIQQKIPETTNEFQPHDQIQCSLTNKDLWDKFFPRTTEMIITKQGRRMFPVLQYSIAGLKPCGKYTVVVDMQLCGNMQWKYTNGSWVTSASMDSHIPIESRPYVHPETPCTGTHLMKQDISFAKMKLTNNKQTNVNGQLLLNSMHKYQPRLIITPEGRNQPSQFFTFPETAFIAVTAYQNTTITELKVEYNPFAKGFRESHDSNGGSTLERKLTTMKNGETALVKTAGTQLRRKHSQCSLDHQHNSRLVVAKYEPPNSAMRNHMYPNHCEYYHPQPLSEFPHPGYQPQIGYNHMNTYYGNQYHPNANGFQTMPSNPSFAQPRRNIKNWLRNVQSNVHLQKTFEQIEKENEFDHTTFIPTDLNGFAWPSSQHHLWNNYPLMTAVKEQDGRNNVSFTDEFNRIQQTTLQPPLLINYAERNTVQNNTGAMGSTGSLLTGTNSFHGQKNPKIESLEEQKSCSSNSLHTDQAGL